MNEPLLATIDALARLRLNARRLGLEVTVTSPSTELRELIELCGLAEVLAVESRWQPEEREDGLGVQEEAELEDPFR
jgi:anti-anti-sigma regulatory factor